MNIKYRCVQAGMDYNGRMWFASVVLPHNQVEMVEHGETREMAKEALRIRLHKGLEFKELHGRMLKNALQALVKK